MEKIHNLIIGGIYLTKNDNYLVVYRRQGKIYNIVTFYGVFMTQYQLQKNHTFSDMLYSPYFIDINSTNISHYFDNGYCGKINDKFLKELQKKTDPISSIRNMDDNQWLQAL